MELKNFFGNELEDFPPRIRDLAASILSPDMPESLDSLLASLPPRPRYIGPEAWLEALSRAADGDTRGTEDQGRKRR